MNTVWIALLSIGLSVCAQFALKAGVSRSQLDLMTDPYSAPALFQVLSNKFIILGLVIYGLSAIVWLGVLARWDVSKAYPLVGLGFALTVLIGVLIGEEVTLMRTIGVLLICLGVSLVGQT